MLVIGILGYLAGKGLMYQDMYPDDWQKNCCIMWEVK